VRYHFFLILLDLLDDFLEGDATNRLEENGISDFRQHSIGLHHYFVLKHFGFVGLDQVLLSPALSFTCNNGPILQLLQRAFNNNHYFLESSHALSEDRLIGLV
jgi:hypothetical protein